jgi:CheY-like chemotaxis protein
MTQPNKTLDRRSKTILGVDDAREIQTLLHAIITNAGYSYVSADNADRAMSEVVSRNPFDVILLDVEMPGVDGYTLCGRIRKHPKGKSVPIVFLTFHNTAVDVEKCKLAGGNAFITKPFTGKTLLQHLDHWSTRQAEPQDGTRLASNS